MPSSSRRRIGRCFDVAPSVALALLTSLALGCEPILGVDFDAARERVQKCELIKPRPPPVEGDGSGSELSVVIIGGEYGDQRTESGEPGYLSIGYDLDDSCTGRGDPSPCVVPPWIHADITDGPQGQDNGAGRMFVEQSGSFGEALLSSAAMAEKERSGEYAPMGILRVRDFNGLFNDRQVSVEWFVAIPPKASANPFVPKFDGSDRWPLNYSYTRVDPQNSAELQTQFVASEAYVSKLQLVARFEKVKWPLANSYNDVEDAIVTATISPNPLEIKDVVVAGAVLAPRILALMPFMTQLTLNKALCTDSSVYGELKRYMCSGIDFKIGDGQYCNAASFAVAFQARPVQLGQIEHFDSPQANCSDPSFHPQYDNCDNEGPP